MIKYYLGIFTLSAIFLAALIYGFSAGGSPARARGEKFDLTRERDLQDLQSTIRYYHNMNKKLPESLAEVDDSYSKARKNDPESGVQYHYEVKGALNYQLCATFSTDTIDKPSNRLQIPSIGPDEYKHPRGYYCFDYQLTPLPYVL